jgi:uncharacterized protein YjeT (DUF2065 family)
MTMSRDAALVSELRESGYTVVGTGPQEAIFELDKIAAKRAIDDCDLPTPRWSETPLPGEQLLFKSAAGTAGLGVRWHDGTTSVPGQGRGYYEAFTQGVEYSLIMLVGEQGPFFLPPVWKGATRADLLPPYKRLRLCGVGVVDVGIVRQLVNAARRLSARCFRHPCIAEIEFVRNADGRFDILEVNPRIAGTTRMAALAAQVPFLDFCMSRTKGSVIQPGRVVAEFPIVAEGDRNILSSTLYATSRLTIAGRSGAEILATLNDAMRAGWRVDAEATAQFHQRAASLGAATYKRSTVEEVALARS